MESRGLTVGMLKLDPYINVDPGTMNPFQHGEVFVTDDGAETDLDLGHYERYTHAELSQKNNYTTGRIYNTVITKERRGDYLGGTIQVIPHVTDEIKRVIVEVADNVDLVITEVGGTVGDIESLPFLEAIRQFRGDVGRDNVCYVHVSLVPFIQTAGELKTKPTQHSVAALREIGIQPDILLCRSDRFLPKDIKAKIALFCNVEQDAVITAKDVDLIYEVPLLFHQEGLDEKIIELLHMWTKAPDLSMWEDIVHRLKHPEDETTIAVVGKYVNLRDSYKSLNEALVHGGLANDCRVSLEYVDSEAIEQNGLGEEISQADGILIPGGFGNRGIEGKIEAIRYARENEVPFFGICLGMQLAVVEYSRNVAGLDGAHSEEFEPATAHPVIYLMKEWMNYRTENVEQRDESSDMGGTMRLGAYPCHLVEGSFAYQAYEEHVISERHRHRYEFNNQYREVLTDKGMRISGHSPDNELVEIMEIRNHPWFLGCQFHPEFKSRLWAPHPLFREFIRASLNAKRNGR